ncbi:MAG TPA: type II secretion system protein [Humisphaera sp.]
MTTFPSAEPSTARTAVAPARRRGFTLVELLVVIGIIALLMSILLPTLGRVKEQANAIKCGSNLRQVGLAFVMYANDNGGKLPPRNASRSDGPTGKTSDWIFWQTGRELGESNVMKYVGGSGVSDALLRCPSDQNADERPLNGNDAKVGPYKYSYTVNVYMITNGQIPSQYDRALNIGTVRNSTEKILAIEEDERTINDGAWMGMPKNNTKDGEPNDYLAIRHDMTKVTPDDSSNWAKNLERRGNAVFLDGHVEYVSRRFVHDPIHVDPMKNQ